MTTPLPTHAPAVADEGSPLANARLAGVLYLVIIVAGVFSELVRTGVKVPGDAAATAAKIADTEWLYRIAFTASIGLILCEAVLTVTFYFLFRPISRTESLLAAALRLVTLPIYAGSLLFMLAALVAATEADHRDDALFLLNLHNYGYAIGLAFFAVHCVVLGHLLVRSRRAPSSLGVLLGVAGAGYLSNSLLYFLGPGYEGSATVILLLPAIIAESWLCGLLLWKGGGARQWAG
jgi:hypothetical protein